MKDKYLENQRKKIDQIDKKIIELIKKRIIIVKKIGIYKKNHNLPFFDKKRFQLLIKKNINLGEKLGIDKNFIKKLYSLIHQLSLKIEKNL